MKVIIVGGGAAGMVAALTAAEQGNQVLLLERQSRVGKKLLATGNGRCNLTNLNLTPANYHGAPSSFIAPALDAFGAVDTLEFFRSLGLLTTAEDSGRVYPLSDQAGSVVDVLRFSLEAAGVQLRTAPQLRPQGHKAPPCVGSAENRQHLGPLSEGRARRCGRFPQAGK